LWQDSLACRTEVEQLNEREGGTKRTVEDCEEQLTAENRLVESLFMLTLAEVVPPFVNKQYRQQ